MRIAVLSDIHANLEAFTSVLADMDSLASPPEEVISLGDVVGYGPDPEACIRLLRERGILSVAGNHELGVARTDCRRWFNLQSREALNRTCKLVGDETVDFIKTLPMTLRRHNALFVHGLPPDSALKYLYEVDEGQFGDLFGSFAEPVAFIGHTHELEIVAWDGTAVRREPLREGVRTLDTAMRYLVNIGAVGQPRDGDPRAKYVLWDTHTRGLAVRFVEYDVETTISKFAAAGMPQRYADRLRGR